MEGVKEDIKSLFAKFKQDEQQLNHEEKRLNLKRRWLMGLTMSRSEEKRLKVSIFQNDRVMPELLLREDDVYCETIRSSIEKGLRVNNVERGLPPVEDIMQLNNSSKDIGRIFSLLDIMTSEALCHVAEILTSGSTRFEKIRWKSRKIIKKCLGEFLRNQNCSQYRKLTNQLSQLLKDPNNFLRNRVALSTCASRSHCAAVEKVLDGLGDLCSLTLHSMYRKLRGVKGYMPQLRPPKSGWGRDKLIDRVRKCCMEMISNVHEGDELPEPLVKAMAVASLAFKLKLGHHSVQEFQHFSTGTEALQNEILNAITLLDLSRKVSISNLKKLQILLDPNAELSNKSLRPAIRNLLTEYLLECNDMESVPDCLSKSLDIICRGSRNAPHRSFTKVEVEDEVECVLSVSSQIKQIAWDLLPEHEFDQEFADAYVEDLEESDDGEGWDDDKWQVEHPQNSMFHLNDTNDQLEDVDETGSTNSEVSASRTIEGSRIGSLLPDERLNRYHVVDGPQIDSTKSPEIVSSNFSLGKANFMHDEQEMARNQFLAVQEACDKTSLVAYQFIGHLLNAFAQIEGLELHRDDVSYLRGFDSVLKTIQDLEKASIEEDVSELIFMQVLQELMPTFTESGRNRAKELMGWR